MIIPLYVAVKAFLHQHKSKHHWVCYHIVSYVAASQCYHFDCEYGQLDEHSFVSDALCLYNDYTQT